MSFVFVDERVVVCVEVVDDCLYELFVFFQFIRCVMKCTAVL